MNLICIIPARGGSKGVINKNLKELIDKPLIKHTIDFAKKVSFFKEIIVSSDSQEINEYCLNENVNIIPRPKELATDTSLVIDAIRHTVKEYENKNDLIVDYIFLLEPTSPIRFMEDFNKSLEYLKNGSDSVATFTKIDTPPSRIWRIKEDIVEPFIENKNPFLPRQMHENGFILTGQIYGFTRELVMKKKSTIIGPKLKPILVKENYFIDIDSEMDFYIAKAKMNYLSDLKYGYYENS